MSRPVRVARTSPSTAPRRGVVRHVVAASMFGGVFLAGAWGVTEAWRWASGDDVLPVRSISVQGTGSARAQELRAFSEIRYGDPLLAVDTDRAERLVREHPWVRDAAVRLVPPDGVAIDVVERKAVAVLATDTGLYLLDEHGLPFKRARPGDGLDLPVVSGGTSNTDGELSNDEVALALSAMRAHAEAGSPGGALSELYLEAPGRVVAVVGDGLRVTLGHEQFRERFEQLERVLQVLGERSEQPSHVRLDDGRRPERVAVRLRTRPEMGEKPGS